jgi:hypothetical protein
MKSSSRYNNKKEDDEEYLNSFIHVLGIRNPCTEFA